MIERVEEDAYLAKYKDHKDRYIFARNILRHKNIKSLIDCACGIGYGTEILADIAKDKIVGIDIDSKAISYAKNIRGKKLGKKAEFVHIDFMNFDCSPKFDAFVSFETIEHVEDDYGFIKKAAECLKKKRHSIAFYS